MTRGSGLCCCVSQKEDGQLQSTLQSFDLKDRVWGLLGHGQHVEMVRLVEDGFAQPGPLFFCPGSSPSLLAHQL